MKTKATALLVALLAASSASASDALDRHLIELGFLSAPVEQSMIVRNAGVQPQDAIEASAIEAGFLTLPATSSVATVQLQQHKSGMDILTENLLRNGFITPTLDTISVESGATATN
ncbi:hypothetical protein CAI21_16060 [Alkalilimnicola ehrlichii]|uniref:Uncharacterized protein n=1 Tax=Alkalilimnicola ehrlichii TaxID=351052 RepID=A0A3E0WP16_9GAMM|nr:hypothetical protein [Alkalilimnicola ehrlichii]RFA26796.1 hypothetical protein CAI21_16060 [Alkalilimnicola ehrlichii]RFA33891.1 hypothetical protein CAL65_16180 [Alkalilimnicola ehrlichii]